MRWKATSITLQAPFSSLWVVNHEIPLQNVEEIAGHGMKGTVNGKELLVGNFKLMNKFSVTYGVDLNSPVYTVIAGR